jgi:hypothetical protein
MYAEDADKITQQKEDAALPFAIQTEDLLDRVLADIFGTEAQFLTLQSELEDLNGTSITDLLGGDGNSSDEDVGDEKGKNGSATTEEEDEEDDNDTDLPLASKSKSNPSKKTFATGAAWADSMQKKGKGGKNPPPRMRKAQKALLKLMVANQMLDAMTMGAEGDDANGLSHLEQMPGENTDLKDAEVKTADPDHGPTDPRVSAKDLAARLFDFKEKKQQQMFAEKGQLHKAYTKTPQQQMQEFQQLIGVAEQSAENKSGLSVRLKFLIKYERNRQMEDYVDPQHAIETVAELAEEANGLRMQLGEMNQRYADIHKSHGKLKQRLKRKVQATTTLDQDNVSDSDSDEEFDPPRDTGVPAYDPMNVEVDRVYQARKILKLQTPMAGGSGTATGKKLTAPYWGKDDVPEKPKVPTAYDGVKLPVNAPTSGRSKPRNKKRP